MGFILHPRTIVEVENVAPDPEKGFDVSAADLIEYLDEPSEVVATWHTHPKADANLSNADYRAFLTLPKLKHYIIGTDGVRAYAVKDGVVLNVAP